MEALMEAIYSLPVPEQAQACGPNVRNPTHGHFVVVVTKDHLSLAWEAGAGRELWRHLVPS
jgi:hypothetical protein